MSEGSLELIVKTIFGRPYTNFVIKPVFFRQLHVYSECVQLHFSNAFEHYISAFYILNLVFKHKVLCKIVLNCELKRYSFKTHVLILLKFLKSLMSDE